MNHAPTTSDAPRTSRKRRFVIALVMVATLATVPALALASHQFSDVPNSNPFHTQVTNLVGAGITAGCSATQYCPKSAVTREQMAAFFNRGLGFAAANAGTILASETFTDYVTGVTLPARGVSGGTVYAKATADLSLFDTSAFCPCGVVLTIVNLDTGDFAPETLFVVPADTVDGVSAASGSVSWVFAIPSGVAHDFVLDAIVFPETAEPLSDAGTDGVGDPDAQVWGNLTVESMPFGATVEFSDVKSSLPDRFQEQIDRLHAR